MICFQPTPENEAVIERVRASTGFTVEQVINFAIAASEHHAELVKSLQSLAEISGRIETLGDQNCFRLERFKFEIKSANEVLEKVGKS